MKRMESLLFWIWAAWAVVVDIKGRRMVGVDFDYEWSACRRLIMSVRLKTSNALGSRLIAEDWAE